MSAYRIHALTEEKDTPLFVTTLTGTEFNTLGELGIDELVAKWCEKRKLTYIDFTVD